MTAGEAKAPLLDGAGQTTRSVALDGSVFAAEPKPQLVHAAVRAELNARRAGTRGSKSRGLVAGGRAKPWRQKGTGRARQGTTRAPQWRGGGVAFPPTMRDFEIKVNRKERRAAFRTALSAHVHEGTLALLDGAAFTEPSTKTAHSLLRSWGKESPTVVVATDEEQAVLRSFRNLERVAVTTPQELEIAAVVWARSLLVSEQALPLVEARARGAQANGGAEE